MDGKGSGSHVARRAFSLSVTLACCAVGSPARADSPPPAQALTGVDHWAFQPLVEPDLDALPGDAGDHPIDRFIRAGQEAAGTLPVERAGRRTLARRLCFDLIGLPPTPGEVEAYLADGGPGATGRLVDRLLASPRYGERWGRHWLDLVRYADTAGDDSDYPIPQAHLYRDYVIDAFNADKPYDVFLREQLAGDLLARGADCPPEQFRERVIATGYIAQTKRFATHKGEDMHLMIEDTLHTTGEVVLGLSLRCARCHDHKNDPVTSEDYYALYGFFKSTRYPHPGSEELRRPEDLVPLVPDGEFAALVAEFEAECGPRVAELEKAIKAVEAEVKDKKARQEKTAEMRAELGRLRARHPEKSSPLAYAVREGKPADAKVQVAGNPRRSGVVVPRGVPEFLHPGRTLEIPGGGSGRLEFARWLTAPENPLTARVFVNRLWQFHFGQGIVATPSDFGAAGQPPTHPELLDWLALRFIESGWSTKAMHRLILSSATWQRASAHDPENVAADPSNATYWRFNRRRLEAEAIRDTMLLLSGDLDLARPGPHPFPPVEKWRFTAHHQFKAVYPSAHRSVYLMVQRLHPHPFLSLFNGPDTTASTPVRDDSTLPLQALFFSNSDFVAGRAEGLARRLLSAAGDGDGARIDRAYRQLFARPPTPAEHGRAAGYLARYREQLAAEGGGAGGREGDTESQIETASETETEAWASLARVLFAANEFVYVD